jgi:hypothetical protein
MSHQLCGRQHVFVLQNKRFFFLSTIVELHMGTDCATMMFNTIYFLDYRVAAVMEYTEPMVSSVNVKLDTSKV